MGPFIQSVCSCKLVSVSVITLVKSVVGLSVICRVVRDRGALHMCMY